MLYRPSIPTPDGANPTPSEELQFSSIRNLLDNSFSHGELASRNVK